MPTTLTGEVQRVTYENEETSFRVIRLGALEGAGRGRTEIAVVGVFQAVGPGTRVRVTGEFVIDGRHGEQFRVETLVPLVPTTLAGLERYLGSGVLPGIGPKRAQRIVAAFGMDTLAVLDTSPERLKEVRGLSARVVHELKSSWSAQREESNLMVLLQTHGASRGLAAKIRKHYGDQAASIVQRSPYRLALDVQGVGFKTADRIARSLGIAGDHPERAQAGVLHEIESLADQGHLFAKRALLVERAATTLEIEAGHIEAAIDALWASGRLVVEDDAVYIARLHRAELATARGVVRLLGGSERPLEGLNQAIERFERDTGVQLAPSQRAAVEAAATHQLTIVTGGPGVGKTTIVRAILSLFTRQRLITRLAAPTGRAAKRLSEATGREASTLHRLLEFDPRANRFTLDREHPLSADAVIVDEASMIDVPLAAALFEALPKHARLVIVGDADQLPSVGPGAFLRDLIASARVKAVRLNEIFRQSERSRIVDNAHRIFRGEMPESADADAPNADFFVIHRRDPEEAAELVKELVVSRIPRRFGLDPRREIQVLTPMHRGPAGTASLNALLQDALNPSGAALEVRGQPLRAFDKVMQTRNDYERDVFNGDLGTVTEVDRGERRLVVRFDDREVEYAGDAVEALVLAYATSIHKSQGSEYPAVVIPLLTTHYVMLSRNLLYTAVTRARRLCVLCADPRALRMALAETRREERMTRLTERIRAS